MKTVCLIIPPSVFLLDERVFVNLGVLKVAASLEAAGWGVEVLDLSGYQNFPEAVQVHTRTSRADVFGISATTAQMPATREIVQAIREISPQKKIILGGPHPTLVVAAQKRERKLNISGRATAALEQLASMCDVVVAGDGEKAIFFACEENAPKVVDADDRRSELFLTNQELENTNPPARGLIDMDSYHYQIDGVRATSLIAQLGCPFGCGFCAGRLSPMLRNIRTRSSENIVEEMVSINHEYGYRGFMFYDDELNVNKDMVALMRAIKQAQQRLGQEWRLRGFIKAELFTKEQAHAMYEAGFRWILVGFESGSPRILENIKKRASREDNTRCMDIARESGLKVKALMSVGHPGESRETIAETRQWLLDVRPSDFDVTIITPYPGSPYYDEAVLEEGRWVYTCSNGDRLYQTPVNYLEEADYYKGDPDDGYVSHVATDALSPKEIVRLRDLVEREVRAALKIPFNPGAAATLYEHSMGQTRLPSRMLRSSGTAVGGSQR